MKRAGRRELSAPIVFYRQGLISENSRHEQDMKSRKPFLHAYPRIRPTIMASKQPETTPHSWKRCPMNNATTFVGLDVHTRSIKARSQPRPQDGPPRRAYPDCVQHRCKRRRTERRVPNNASRLNLPNFTFGAMSAKEVTEKDGKHELEAGTPSFHRKKSTRRSSRFASESTRQASYLWANRL